MSRLEHVNITVPDVHKTAQMLHDVFGWGIRWQGETSTGGYSMHVGDVAGYVAIYTGPGGGKLQPAPNNYLQSGGLNHIGVVVDDLDAVEARVNAAGLSAHMHGDYEPGRRFYFNDADGIEWEVISYD